MIEGAISGCDGWSRTLTTRMPIPALWLVATSCELAENERCNFLLHFHRIRIAAAIVNTALGDIPPLTTDQRSGLFKSASNCCRLKTPAVDRTNNPASSITSTARTVTLVTTGCANKKSKPFLISQLISQQIVRKRASKSGFRQTNTLGTT